MADAAGPAPPEILLTKLHPPAVPDQVLERPRLLDRLDAGAALKLSLVACPAGFGKTTLLAAWGRRAAERRPVAWVSVDNADDDPVVLWSHCVAALAAARPELPGADLATLVATAPLREVALPRLVNALSAAGESALVLDDLHRLQGPAARESVEWFIQNAPRQVHVVVASRTDPALRIGALRARGQLLELRADELRMDDEEASLFLNDRLGLGLTPADVSRLVARTEGWPAGIYLAALSLRSAPDPGAFVREFGGASAHVADYLAGEVLAAHGARIRHVMLRISVLERFCAELCQAVLEEDGAREVLAELAAANLFLLPLDDRREWYRFHHLFAQLLRGELRRTEPALVPALHRRASRWHAEHGTIDEAIHHALEAGDTRDAARLVQAAWVVQVNAGRTDTVAEWLGRLPDGVTAADPALLVVRAWTSALRGREREMRDDIAAAQALGGLDEGPLPDGFSSIAGSIATLSAAFGWGDAGAMLHHGALAARREGRESPWRPVVAWSLGWGHYCRGDLEQAERWLGEAAALGPAAGQWVVATGALADLSIMAGMRGDPVLQAELAGRAMEQARGAGLLDACEVGEVHTAHGLVLVAEGRPGDALPALEKGVFLRRIWGQPLDLLDGLVALAPAVAAAGDPGRSRALLAEAARLAARCRGADGLRARLAAARAPSAPARPTAALSARERTVLRLLSGGMSEREIGTELRVSFNTVHSHVKSLYRKLGASSRGEALLRAREAGLLP